MCLLKEVKTILEFSEAITECPKCHSAISNAGVLTDRYDYFHTKQLTVECITCDMANTYLVNAHDLHNWAALVKIPIAPNGRFNATHNPLHPSHWIADKAAS